MKLKPRKIAQGIEQEARRMGRELELQVNLDITTVEEFAAVQEMVLQRVQELEVIGPDLPAAQAILEWLRSLSHEVHRKRFVWETKQRLITRLDALIEEQGLQEQATELHKTLSSFGDDSDQARRWLRGFGREHGRNKRSLADIQITVASKEVTTIIVGVKDDYDRRLSYLEDRASEARGSKARKLYSEGRSTENRREKIRLFKRAIHEGVVFEKTAPKVTTKG